MPVKGRITNISLSQSETVDLILSWTKNLDDTLIVKELNPYPHFHFYLPEESLSCNTIRKRLNPYCSGNQDFSVDNKHSDWTGYCSYLVKHDDTLILHIGKYDLNELRDYYQGISRGTKKKIKEIKRLKSYDDFVSKEFGPDSADWTDPRKILKCICKMDLEGWKIFNKALQGQVLQTLYYKYNLTARDRYLSAVLESEDLLEYLGSEMIHLRMENKALKEHLKSYLRSTDPEVCRPQRGGGEMITEPKALEGSEATLSDTKCNSRSELCEQQSVIA